MKWLKKWVAGEPDRDAALRRVEEGVAEAAAGRFESALRAYRRAQELDPTCVLAHLNEGLALQDLYNARAAQWTEPVRLSWRGDIRESIERALDLDNDLIVGWRVLGHVERRRGDYVAAQRAFEALLSRLSAEDDPPQDVLREIALVKPRAQRQRALHGAFSTSANPEATHDEMREALTLIEPLLLDPASPDEILFTAGVLARRLNDLEAAADYWEACLERLPHHIGAHGELANLYRQRGDLQASLRHCLEAYREDPSNPGLLCNVGVSYLALGDLDEAQEYLHIAQQLAPADAIVQDACAALASARERMRATS
ncbi:MAG: tetratricopeptide repeat protein [Myxococcota bacterium]